MHALVTGGAGFIGSHSVEVLLGAGMKVTVFDNFSTGKRGNLPAHPQLRVIEGDIRDGRAVAAAMQGITHVLHLAAQIFVRVSIAEPLESCGHNITGFVTVLDAARRAGVRRVVYASSAAVYGMPAELPLTEQSATGPLSPYGLEKLINDQYAGLFADLYGQNVMGLRYFNVYGPRQDPSSPYAGVISLFADRLRRGAPLTVFGDGGQTRDFVYVKDIARCNALALQSDAHGFCNVGTGRSVTLLTLIETLAAGSASKPQINFEAAVKGDIRESAMLPDRLRQAIGYVPDTPLADGLAALLAS